MPSRGRFFAGLFLLLAAAFVTARFGLELRGPHVMLVNAPPLNVEKRHEIEEALTAKKPKTRAEALDFALDYTARSLRFSLDHPTSFRFDSATRDGSCIEYAYLFAETFNLAAKVARSPARAVAVRSTDPRVVGVRVPAAAFRDHDFAVVEGDGERLFVDPTLYDAHLGWDVAFNVKDKSRIASR